jgi:hypothetical protein
MRNGKGVAEQVCAGSDRRNRCRLPGHGGIETRMGQTLQTSPPRLRRGAEEPGVQVRLKEEP